jgi:hypothetical protein
MRHFGTFVFIAVLLLSFTGTVLADETETPDMKARNQQFRAREAARPPQDTSYKNTKEYKAATPDQQRKCG